MARRELDLEAPPERASDSAVAVAEPASAETVPAGRPGSPASVLAMQRGAGNAAVARLLGDAETGRGSGGAAMSARGLAGGVADALPEGVPGGFEEAWSAMAAGRGSAALD